MTFLKPDSKNLMEYFMEFTKNRELGFQLSSQAYNVAGKPNGSGGMMYIILALAVVLILFKK